MATRLWKPAERILRDIPETMTNAITLGAAAVALAHEAAEQFPAAQAATLPRSALPSIAPAAGHQTTALPSEHAADITPVILQPTGHDGYAAADGPLPSQATEQAHTPSQTHTSPHADLALEHAAPFSIPTVGATPTSGDHSLSTDHSAQTTEPTGSGDFAALGTSQPTDLHGALTTLADQISGALKGFADHIELTPSTTGQLTSVVQHVGDIASNIQTMVGNIASAATAPLSGTLDHVLGATDSVLAHSSQAGLPPSLLGAELGAHDTSGQDAAAAHVDLPAVETSPVQIGFLGQSYTELIHPHDVAHGSMLHGLV